MEGIKFPETGTMAMVHLATSDKKRGELLEINENGEIILPSEKRPPGFFLTVIVPQTTIACQKDREGKKYKTNLLISSELQNGYKSVAMCSPIPVLFNEQAEMTFVPWKNKVPNTVDLIEVYDDGTAFFRQIGIVCRDNDKNMEIFKVIEVPMWKGMLFRTDHNEVVEIADSLRWGNNLPKEIFKFPAFREAIEAIQLDVLQGEKMDIPLPPPTPHPEHLTAKVSWLNLFMGFRAQGRAVMANGEEAWIHGEEAANGYLPCRGDTIIYSATRSNSDERGSLRLLCFSKLES